MIAVFLGAFAVFGVAWYYAGQIYEGAFKVKRESPPLDLTVQNVSGGIITLLADKHSGRDWRREGVYGLVWEDGGYARVGRILDLHKSHVVREFTLLDRAPAPGTRARLDMFVYRTEPSAAGGDFAGIPLRRVPYTAPLGPTAAWQTEGTRDTWFLFVHGKGSMPSEALRILPTVHAQGLPALLIHYRNDEDAPQTEDRRYGYGFEEWRDVAAAMDHARSQGARRFVIGGNSMGGAIIMALLQQPAYASSVSGVVLDSPVLDFAATIDFHGRQRKLPGPVTSAAKAIANLRYGVDWASLDFLRQSHLLNAPVLLFHGTGDTLVPVSTSDRLAELRPDLVTYMRIEGVAHVRNWNHDPAAYEQALTEFLRKVAP